MARTTNTNTILWNLSQSYKVSWILHDPQQGQDRTFLNSLIPTQPAPDFEFEFGLLLVVEKVTQGKNLWVELLDSRIHLSGLIWVIQSINISFNPIVNSVRSLQLEMCLWNNNTASGIQICTMHSLLLLFMVCLGGEWSFTGWMWIKLGTHVFSNSYPWILNPVSSLWMQHQHLSKSHGSNKPNLCVTSFPKECISKKMERTFWRSVFLPLHLLQPRIEYVYLEPSETS